MSEKPKGLGESVRSSLKVLEETVSESVKGRKGSVTGSWRKGEPFGAKFGSMVTGRNRKKVFLSCI